MILSTYVCGPPSHILHHRNSIHSIIQSVRMSHIDTKRKLQYIRTYMYLPRQGVQIYVFTHVVATYDAFQAASCARFLVSPCATITLDVHTLFNTFDVYI